MLGLDAMMDNSHTIVSNHVQDDYVSMGLKKETVNGNCSDALKNDVKLNQYNVFNNYFMPNQASNQVNQINDHSHQHSHHQQHHQQQAIQCDNVVDTRSYHDDPMANNNNNKGVRNALMSEIGSLSPLNQMMHPQNDVGMYRHWSAFSINFSVSFAQNYIFFQLTQRYLWQTIIVIIIITNKITMLGFVCTINVSLSAIHIEWQH